jgi:hypothetical protein
MISLQEECEAFRHVTLSTANQLSKLEALAKRESVSEILYHPHLFFKLTSLPSSQSQEPPRLDAATFFKAHPLNSSQTSSSTSHPLTADTRLREIIGRVRSCIETDVAGKEEAERIKKDLLMEMVNSYEGERVERVKELMEQKMRDLVKELGESSFLTIYIYIRTDEGFHIPEKARGDDGVALLTYDTRPANANAIPGADEAEHARLV